MVRGRASSPHVQAFQLGNWDCWLEREACYKFELPPVCPHARERLTPDWKSFDHYRKEFMPKWMERGGTRAPADTTDSSSNSAVPDFDHSSVTVQSASRNASSGVLANFAPAFL